MLGYGNCLPFFRFPDVAFLEERSETLFVFVMYCCSRHLWVYDSGRLERVEIVIVTVGSFNMTVSRANCALKENAWTAGYPSPHPPPAMHISSISISAFIKTCDTSVVLKLQCLKMQACSLLIISVQSSCLMDILGSGPLRSLHHGSATNLKKKQQI